MCRSYKSRDLWNVRKSFVLWIYRVPFLKLISISILCSSAYNHCILRNETSVAMTKWLLSISLGKNVVLSFEIFPLIVTILSRSSEHIFYSFKMYHFTCSHPTTTTTTLTKGRCLCKSLTFLLLLRFTAFFDLGSIFQ